MVETLVENQVDNFPLLLRKLADVLMKFGPLSQCVRLILLSLALHSGIE